MCVRECEWVHESRPDFQRLQLVQFGMDEDVWDGEGGHSDANPEEDESEEMELLWSGPNLSGRAKKRSSTFPLFHDQFGRRIHFVGN